MNVSRRKFIRQSFISSSLLGFPFQIKALQGTRKNRDFGVILGLLKSELEADYGKTLKLVADLGYTEVEFSETYGVNRQDFRNALHSHGLTAIAGGSSMYDLLNETGKLVDDALYFQKPYVICYWPWMDGGINKTLDDFKEAAERLNLVGEMMKKEGLKLAFHNHDKEFVEVGDGKLGYDVILGETDPNLVDMEIDLYWIVKGNADPVEYFKKHPGRFKICHVKDMDAGPDRSFATVGKGIIDFRRIFRRAERAGLKHFIVEYDSAPDPVATATESIQYLKQLKF